MFKTSTVFVIGAGASCHYGYPTGERLTSLVVEKAMYLKTYLAMAIKNGDLVHRFRPTFIERDAEAGPLSPSAIQGQWLGAIRECDELISRITTVDPIVIDYFLGQNQDVAILGKFLVAWVILECEYNYLRRRAERQKNENQEPEQNNWLRFVLHKLISDCQSPGDILNNDVGFITFNYDVSLEHTLSQQLSCINYFSEDTLVSRFLAQTDFVHVYGRIRENPFFPIHNPIDFGISLRHNDQFTYFNGMKRMLDEVFCASKLLRTIAPHEKTVSDEVTLARTALARAELVYILGFGFDENNVNLLQFREVLAARRSGRKVLFTNYGDVGVINKRASRTFFGTPDRFERGRSFATGPNDQYEKSSATVYNAFAHDFDEPD